MMVLKILLIMWPLFTAAISSSPSAIVTADPSKVSVGSPEVTLTCRALAFDTLSGIVIEKEMQSQEWSTIVSISSGDSSTRVLNPFLISEATGAISATGGQSWLQVKIPSSGALGLYKCFANGLDSAGNTIYSDDNVTVSLASGEYGGCCQAVTDLQNAFSSLNRSVRAGELGTRAAWDSNTLASIDGDSLFRLLHWPTGIYSLLQPNTGCPHQEFSYRDWSHGYRGFHTESTSGTNKDEVPKGHHLTQPVQTKSENKNYINLHFCSATDLASEGPRWPNGTFCVLKFLECPEGFHEGSITWDDENYFTENRLGGIMPSGIYDFNTVLYFCCRRDGNHNQPIILPLSRPFYLFRFNGACQKVAGARVRNEYIIFDTEDSGGNFDEYYGDYHPDGSLNNVRLELCYYERDV